LQYFNYCGKIILFNSIPRFITEKGTMETENMGKEQLLSELKESRRQREKLQASLDRIIDITAGIIYVLDPDGKFVFVNNAVEEILQYDPEELIGKHFSEIMSPNEYKRVSRLFVLPKLIGKKTGDESAPKLFDERRTGPRKTKNLEVQLLTKSQKDVRIMAGDVTGIIAVEGAYDRELMQKNKNKAVAFVGSQGLIFDITKYKQAEMERLDIQRRLFELQKMDAVGRLAEGIAHDFNNKLGTILGCAEMMKQNCGPAARELDAYINPVISASKHAADLTGKLLLFARSSTPRAEEDVNIHTLVLNVVHLLEHTADKRISIQQSLLPQSPMVRGDLKQIQSAILNIAINACEAMPEGGELLFETTTHTANDAFLRKHAHAKDAARYMCLSVTDSGVGMGKDVQSRMFEPFFTTKTDGSSIGMGLTSVSNCVKSHNGFIEVESAPGKGTRMDVFLPLEKLEPSKAAGAAPVQKVKKGSGRILVVDDELSFLNVSKDILEDLGYSVVTRQNGREAVTYYRGHHKEIDCAIIDVMMPELSGCDCFRELKKINPSIKAIISTGYGLNKDVESVLKDGVADFIQKPFESARLSQVLSKILTPR
jgi:PAS domain S-box-containing protein